MAKRQDWAGGRGRGESLRDVLGIVISTDAPEAKRIDYLSMLMFIA